MTNHLVRRHASPTTLTIGVHLGKSVERFVAVGYLTESFHFAKATLSIQMGTATALYHSQGPSRDKSYLRCMRESPTQSGTLRLIAIVLITFAWMFFGVVPREENTVYTHILTVRQALF